MKNPRPTSGLCVDGACQGNPGLAEYQAIDLKKREFVFSYKIGKATNNVAEFLALVNAISDCIVEEKNENNVIYSDSMTALWWIRKKEANSKTKCSPLSETMMNRASNLLRTIEIDGNPAELLLTASNSETGRSVEIRKWMTKEWGENPADFGRK